MLGRPDVSDSPLSDNVCLLLNPLPLFPERPLWIAPIHKKYYSYFQTKSTLTEITLAISFVSTKKQNFIKM